MADSIKIHELAPLYKKKKTFSRKPLNDFSLLIWARISRSRTSAKMVDDREECELHDTPKYIAIEPDGPAWNLSTAPCSTASCCAASHEHPPLVLVDHFENRMNVCLFSSLKFV